MDREGGFTHQLLRLLHVGGILLYGGGQLLHAGGGLFHAAGLLVDLLRNLAGIGSQRVGAQMDLACGLANLQNNFLQAAADAVNGVDQLADLVLTRHGQAGTEIPCSILPGKMDHIAQRSGQHTANKDHEQTSKQDR